MPISVIKVKVRVSIAYRHTFSSENEICWRLGSDDISFVGRSLLVHVKFAAGSIHIHRERDKFVFLLSNVKLSNLFCIHFKISSHVLVVNRKILIYAILFKKGYGHIWYIFILYMNWLSILIFSNGMLHINFNLEH